MHNFIKIILLSIILTLSLQASTGLTQTHLLSLYPEVSAQAISADSTIEIEFDSKIIKSSVKNNTIILKSSGKKIKGKTTIKNSTTLLFTPKEILKTASYKVKVKKVKLQDKANKKIYKDKNGVVYQVCSYLCDDIDDCILPKCGKKAIKTKKIVYSFSADSTQAQVTNIKLNKQTINLNNDDTTTIKVTATYNDNSTKDITDKTEWIISDNSIISIDKNIIIPNKEGTTSLQARYKNQITDEIEVTIYKEINGYRLPPEPDPTINNSTPLGIDSNGNGVRDDVEIYVIKRYAQDSEFPKTKTAIAMQYAWAEQKIIDNPIVESKKYSNDVVDCEFYWLKQKTKDMTSLNGIKYHIKHSVFNDKDINDKIYNTRTRIERSFEFNQACSGNIFEGREQSLDNCQINIDEIGE